MLRRSSAREEPAKGRKPPLATPQGLAGLCLRLWRANVRAAARKAVARLGILATGLGGAYGAYHLVLWAGLLG